MKQLIHSTGPHVIAALNESAYVVLSSTTNDTNAVVQLVPSTESGGGDVSGGNPVHAVASLLSLDEETLYCAVSRQDKTLALYSVPVIDNGDESESEKSKRVEPIAVHGTPKRVGSLLFARVPHRGDETDPLDVVISGDFEGNVTAYPVPPAESESKSSFVNSSRLLLGHTASMLTGVKIIENGTDGKMKILTSDRDEKIRVSSFPDTYVVEGYLLGHTAFVSSLDISRDKSCPYCVTCGGDGTIRLWDFTTCEELDVVEASVKPSDGSTDGEQQDHGDVDVPVSVAMSPDGGIVAAIWNESSRVDIFKVLSEPKSLSKVQAFECPEKPLVATFLSDGTLCLLARDPAYLFQYEMVSNDAGQVSSFASIEKSRLCTALRNVGAQHAIKMTLSALEVDDLKKEEVQSRQDVRDKEWNNAERKERAKDRTRRRKKRKRERKRAQIDE